MQTQHGFFGVGGETPVANMAWILWGGWSNPMTDAVWIAILQCEDPLAFAAS